VRGSALAAFVMGGFAMLIGIGWIFGAVSTRRRRADIAPTYSAAGGLAYSFFQFGCAAIMILLGIGLIVGMLLEGGLR
jgi:hypothetical protein